MTVNILKTVNINFSTATFTLHIRNIVKKARDKMGWVLRVFQSRQRSLMLTLFKSFIIPLLEYCCQLWNPWKAKDIYKLLKLFNERLHTKSSKYSTYNYWEILHELKLYSLQRRRERYIIIYICNATQHMVPNGKMGHNIKTRKQPRHGTQCVIQYPTNRNPAQSLQENAITVFGPRLYSLPKYMKDIESVKTEKFKYELDKFLELIPDEPKMPN